jgi:hypothetical protein
MIFLIAVGVLFAGYGTASLASDDVRYVTRAGLEESRILREARPLEDVVRDPGIRPTIGYFHVYAQIQSRGAALRLSSSVSRPTSVNVV